MNETTIQQTLERIKSLENKIDRLSLFINKLLNSPPGQKKPVALIFAKVVLTGRFSVSRQEMRRRLEAVGMTITTNVKEADLLLFGEYAGSKLLAAKSRKIHCVSEDRLDSLMSSVFQAQWPSKASGKKEAAHA